VGKLRQLAGQTVIYGLSSIVARLLNYMLFPLYTYVFKPGVYGISTEFYAYVSFLIIVMTYGMETGFFRFSENEKGNPKVYSTTLISLIVSSFIFSLLIYLFAPAIASVLHYENHQEYIIWFGIIIGVDAVASIPFAWLRQQNKALKFAAIKIFNILVFIALNLFFLLLCPYLVTKGITLPLWLFNPEIGIGYIFIANLIASILTLVALIPYMRIEWKFDYVLWKKIILYSLPLLVAGLAGMVNETFDRAMLKRLLPDITTAMDQLGIYGANYKVAVLMTLFIQTFRYAAEPFFFSQSKEKNAKELYAEVMKFFVIFGLFIFLGVMLYIDVVKFLISKEYWSGLKVVPILLAANLFLGIFYNLSIWFKLTNKTRFGAYLAIFGAVITIALNFWLIPIMGYMGSAWATLICYFAMMVVSYFIGNVYYKVNYPLTKIGLYFSVAAMLFAISYFVHFDKLYLSLGFNTILLLGFTIFVLALEPSLLQKLNKR
jgi:O-antigen/teichoic acid export membrane protein